MPDKLDVVCPCCSTRLVIDATTGDVLSEDRPRQARSFEDALEDVRGGSRRREDAFSKAFDRTKRQDDVLDKKFEEAKKKASRDPSSKPRNPFDMD
jgi:hypothetical protein